jgi:Ca2+-binding EF-hand superfamily protein
MTSTISSALGGVSHLNALRDMMQTADKDGDGKITKDELTAVQPKNYTGPSVETIFSKLDTNGDGAIDVTENETARTEMDNKLENFFSGLTSSTSSEDLQKLLSQLSSVDGYSSTGGSIKKTVESLFSAVA